MLEAGSAVRTVYEETESKFTLKEDQSPLTEADKASQQILIKGLQQLAPEIPILSEEAAQPPYDLRKDWEHYFLIDPVDGTREFVKRIPEFSINVALIRKNRPVMGMIYSPIDDDLYVAEKGSGAYRIKNLVREKLPLSAAVADDGAVRVFLSRTDFSVSLDSLLSRIPNHTICRMGSSLKFCAIATGEADFYPRLKPSMEWDTAAGTVIVEESGGQVTELQGNAIFYNRENLVNPPFFVIGKSMVKKMPDYSQLLFSQNF